MIEWKLYLNAPDNMFAYVECAASIKLVDLDQNYELISEYAKKFLPVDLGGLADENREKIFLNHPQWTTPPTEDINRNGLRVQYFGEDKINQDWLFKTVSSYVNLLPQGLQEYSKFICIDPSLRDYYAWTEKDTASSAMFFEFGPLIAQELATLFIRYLDIIPAATGISLRTKYTDDPMRNDKVNFFLKYGFLDPYMAVLLKIDKA